MHYLCKRIEFAFMVFIFGFSGTPTREGGCSFMPMYQTLSNKCIFFRKFLTKNFAGFGKYCTFATC